jgi:nitrate reductase (cytochrome), electron transfer subunit
MRLGDPRSSRLWLPILVIGSALTAIAAVIVAFERAPERRPPEPEPTAVAMPAAPAESIAAEAQVFRTRAGMMAIAFAARRERQAHPRTLKTMRYLRAYPGAPPRIPHELTPDEFRTGACQTCHERGGYSRRFAAYVPVTPHAGNGACLQCHVGADQLMAVSLVSQDPNRRCHQCHGAGGRARAHTYNSVHWRTTPWPQLSPTTPDRTPPPIPHDLQSRGNCLACHAGPAAVAEIRTTHPERADCRQCHVAPDSEMGVFTRAASAGGNGTGGAP